MATGFGDGGHCRGSRAGRSSRCRRQSARRRRLRALVKDLKVKGAGQTLKQGTVIKSIRLTVNPEEIDCQHDAIKGLVLRTEFVRKR
jgi:hypothetical protein